VSHLIILTRALPSQRETPKRARDIDLDTGRKVWDSAEKLNAWRAECRAQPLWKRTYIFLFSG
jgi:hypothetical protein